MAYSKFDDFISLSLGLEQKVSDEMRHKFLYASSHHSVFNFLQPKPGQLIGILVHDEFLVINDSLLTFTTHPTAHRLTIPVFSFSSMLHPTKRAMLKWSLLQY